jgi:hypothetical protein
VNWDGRALISQSYVEQNRLMHRAADFGAESFRWAQKAAKLIADHGCKDALDYGCGKGTFAVALAKFINIPVAEYDPAISGKDGLPGPADFVICNDVMEHVEPDYVDNVLDHLASLVRRVGLIGIATKYALSHCLPDGRNPHLSVHDGDWWQGKLESRFAVKPFATRQKEYACVVTHKEPR